MLSRCPRKIALATYAPPLLKAEGRLSWDAPAHRIVNTIRAFDPLPGAYGFFRGQRLKFFQAGLLSWKGEGAGRGNCRLHRKRPGSPGW